MRPRYLLTSLAAALTVVALCGTAAGASTIVLGGGDTSAGLGKSRPTRVWLGGDASTVYFKLRWTRWGSRRAAASGRGYDVPPYADSVPIRLLAQSRGICDGRRAYLRIRISKYVGGRWSSYGTGFSVCQS